MNSLPTLGTGAWVFISAYLFSLLIIGWIARSAKKSDTLKDFYLAGNGFGFLVLFLTFFATQYSGNTFFAFTGATYRIGYTWILSLHFMTAVVVVYLLFAPQLHALAKKRNYLTPADFIDDRYGNRFLSLLISVVMIIVLCNFTLAQLMAMGRAMQGLSGNTDSSTYTSGVIMLALIMVIYGTLGGVRAIAWTDALQGTILFFGFAFLLVLVFDRFGSLEKATLILVERDFLQGTKYTTPPDADSCRAWLSYVLAVGFGVSLYPQAIQRIYAAKSATVLRKSLSFMAFMPLPTMIISTIAGIMALAYFPGLEGPEADRAFGTILREIQLHSVIGYGLVVVTLAAVLAAMMSTADSALLSVSSMLTKDIVAKYVRSDFQEATLTKIGKILSWSFITMLVVLAIILQEDTSLVQLLDRKIDLLIQLSPAFILGVRYKSLVGAAVLAGLCVGIMTALTLAFGGFEFVENGKIAGFHPGLVALLPNLMITIFGSLLLAKKLKKS
ncbi:MAG: sodium:solute symporter family protein [Pseudomonadota bacterium]|nr:sodium:solute symporter family protein [Pseudomonadota bacterium]